MSVINLNKGNKMNLFERKEPSFDNTSAREPAPVSVKPQPAPRKKYVRRKIKQHPILNYWINLILFAIIGFSLLGINFVLYASSGYDNIYAEFPVMRPEITISLCIIGTITAILYFIFSGYSLLLCILTSGIMYIFSLAMFHQFANFNSEALANNHSSSLISLILAVATFFLLFFSNKKIRFFFACAAMFAFGAVLYHQNYTKAEFNIVENSHIADPLNQSDKKIISIMLPNLPSYGYIAGLEDSFANKIYREQLREIMLGFYAKHGFKLFPNAYVAGRNPYINAANSLNLSVPEEQFENIQTKVMKDSYWQFKNRTDFEAYLKNNKAVELLKQHNYAVSAYQSHGINLCRQNNINNVDRCVTTVANPVRLKASPWEDSWILMAQWLERGKFMKSMWKVIYDRIKPFYDIDNFPILGMSYTNLHTVDTLKTLDLTAENIINDKGNHAYLLFIDMPSETFVYDEMCRLKPTEKWLSKNNKPWVGRNNVSEKRSAYMHQSMCLYGKLGQFMHKLQNSGVLENAVVIIQGLNGMDDMLGDADDSLVSNFLNSQLTDVAIFDSANKKFTINKSICSIPSIINQHFNGEKCSEFDDVTTSKTTKQAVRNRLNPVEYTNDIAQKSYQKYMGWMKAWNQINFQSLALAPRHEENSTFADDEIIHKQPQMLPLEEKTLEKQKVMSGQVNVEAEAPVKSLSEVAQIPVEE